MTAADEAGGEAGGFICGSCDRRYFCNAARNKHLAQAHKKEEKNTGAFAGHTAFEAIGKQGNLELGDCSSPEWRRELEKQRAANAAARQACESACQPRGAGNALPFGWAEAFVHLLIRDWRWTGDRTFSQ